MRKVRLRKPRSIAALALSAVLVGALAAPLGAASGAFAAVTSQLGLTKTADATTVVPGEQFTYALAVSCSSITDIGCRDAQLIDNVPAEFEIVAVNVASSLTANTPIVDGQKITIDFVADLGDGTVGIVDGAAGTVSITVKLRDDTPYEASGKPVTNTANATSSNTADVTASATVTPEIELVLGTEVTKAFVPTSGPNVAGTLTAANLTAKNTSNAAVDKLVISDPVDPTATPNAFDYLAFVETLAVTYPPNADTVTLEFWNGSAWVAAGSATKPGMPNAPPGPEIAAATGIRYTFTDSQGVGIKPGAEATVSAGFALRDNVEDLTESVTVKNTVDSTVSLDTETANAVNEADYRIVAEAIAVGATKSFAPEAVLAGESSTVTLGASNTSETPLDTLTVREPTVGSFTTDVAFTGFTAPVQFPAGADEASITIEYLDAVGDPQSLTTSVVDGGAYPTLPAGSTLTSFEVTFSDDGTGTKITSGASTEIAFGVTVNEDKTPGTIRNVVGVIGTAGNNSVGALATDDLTVLEKILALETHKKISPGQMMGIAGQHVTVQLPTTLKAAPESTTSADTITVQDPKDSELGNSAWWDLFDPVSITKTDIPPGTSLTVRYYDLNTQTWKELPGAVDIAGGPGGTSFSFPIDPSLAPLIGGFQLEFSDPDGFPPGTTLQPNFTSVLTESLDPKPAGSDIVVENCAAATAEATNVTPGTAETADPCPTIELIAPTPGEGDLIEKTWIDPTSKIVSARSGEQATARLNWSTGGYDNLSEVIVADVADAPASDADVAASVFQAFNLVAVKAITSSLDPLIQYDQVTAVELWNGTAWVEATSSPCPAGCQGTLPEIKLTPTEQLTTTSVRLRFAENTTARQNATAVDAPLPGSGVASSFGNNRAIDLVFEVRDLVRVNAPGVDPDPALGSRDYNTPTPGDVNNTASATGFTGATQVVRDVDSDIISILDRPLNTTVTKGWTGGPLGIPPAGTAPDNYPSGRVVISGTNATVAKVDTLRISDSAPGALVTPFDVFDLKDIINIVEPAGTVSTEVTLYTQLGSTTYSRTVAMGLSEAALANIVGISVQFDGRIAPNAKGTLTLDLRLRATHRDGSGPVTVVDSPIANEARSVVEDLGGVEGIHTAVAVDGALIRLEDLNISVLTTKTFSPQAQVQPDNSDVLMTLTARPGGSARTAKLEVTDDTATFWNIFEFVGFDPSFALASPIRRVQVDALTGGTFVAGAGNSLNVTGGSWQLGVAGTTPALPVGVLPADVQGLRFTFTRADGSQWENPSNPLQKMPLLVKRLQNMRSLIGGVVTPVATDDITNVAAPGEPIGSAPGHFTNTVSAVATSSTHGSGSVPLTATHSTTAQVLYLHPETSVSVIKGPRGAQNPGVEIPFTLEVTNPDIPGNTNIVNPVIVDKLPIDSVTGLPQLIFDPDATSSPYSYEFAPIATAPTAPELPMPTDPAQISVTVNSAQTEISFAFPPGTVLQRGETYTITIKLMFRPGVQAGEINKVSNAFDITADAPFDVCNGFAGPTAVSSCEAATEVYPVSAGSLRGHKFVKADDTELGVMNVVNPANSGLCRILGATDGFYEYPCVPITKPGTTETWRETMQNTGTLPQDRLVTIDRLPTPGDSGVFVDLPRGSEWRPLWVGNLAAVPGGHLPTITQFYTSSAQPCVADLWPTGTQCAPGAWLPLDDTVDPTTVAAVKSVFDFGSTPLLPGEYFEYTFQTRSPAVSPTSGADTIAWNTVAIGARTVDAGAGGALGSVLPSEAHRVGVALATGPLTVVKKVTGDGAAFAPATFDAQLSCTSAVGTPLETVLPPIDVVLEANVEKQIDNLPWGAVCELEESDQGQTSWESDSATVGRSDEPIGLITLTNNFELAGLTITKTVESAAVDQDGNAIIYGPFEISVSCTFLAQDVYATGYSDTNPMVKNISNGDTWSLEGLPAGAECTVEETDAKGANTTIEAATDDGALAPVAGTSTTLTLTPVVDGLSTVTVDVINEFGVGEITINKVVTGSGADEFGAGPFTFEVICTLNDASGSRDVWTGLVKLGGGKPLTASIENIAAGAACSVDEIDAAGADVVTIAPNTPTVVGDGAAVTFTATNEFKAGSLVVSKERLGEGVDLYGAGPFVVELSCVPVDGGAVEIPGGATRELNEANNYTARYDPLPYGALCRLSETTTGGATSSTIVDVDGDVHAGFIVGDDVETELFVENRFDVGSIEVTKTITGSGAADAANKRFTVSLACTVDVDGVTEKLAIPGGAERVLSKSTSLTAVYEMLPVGAKCELTETDNAGAASVSISPSAFGNPAVGVATVRTDGPFKISVVNTFNKVPPLVVTGVDPVPLFVGALGVLGLGGIILLIVGIRRRRNAQQ